MREQVAKKLGQTSISAGVSAEENRNTDGGWMTTVVAGENEEDDRKAVSLADSFFAKQKN